MDGDRGTLAVVQAWDVARNDGDIDAAKELVSEDARLFGVSMQLPERRDAFVDSFGSKTQPVGSHATSIAASTVSPCRAGTNKVMFSSGRWGWF